MKHWSWFIAGGAFVFILVIGWLQWSKLGHFGYNGLDLGIYTQTAWSLAHGLGWWSSIHDPSYLGDHFELFLLPLGALYRLFPTPLTLLWAQTLVLASAVIPLSLLVRARLGRTAAVVAAGLFFIHPLVYNVALYEFHGLVFALPIILWAILVYRQENFRWWLLCLVLLTVVREDMPLLVAGWAVLAAIDRRPRRWWLSATVTAVVWFFVAQLAIRTASPLGNYKYLAFYGWLGTSWREIVIFPLRHPLLFLGHVVHPRNWETVIGFLAVAGFLPLFRPRALWPAVFVGGQLLLLNAEAQSILRLHYVIPFLPFLWWAAINAVADWRRNFCPLDGRMVMAILAITGPLYGLVAFGPFGWPWRNVPPAQTDPAILRAAVTTIQPADRVLTTFNFLPALANRQDIYSLNYVYLGRRQYSEIPYRLPGPIDAAVIDWLQLYEYQFLYKETLFQRRTGPERIERALADNNLRLVWQHDAVAIYARRGPAVNISIDVISSRTASVDGIDLVARNIDPVTTLRLKKRRWSEVAIDQRWTVRQTPTRPISVRYALRRGQTTVWSTTRLLTAGPRPATEWLPGSTLTVTDRLAIPERFRGSLRLQATYLQQGGRLRPDRWLSFEPVIETETPRQTVDLGRLTLP